MLHPSELRSVEHDINAIAQQFSLPVSEVHDIVWDEIHSLEQRARIRDFIPLLAAKEVKAVLRASRPH